ncbi:Retrovirus-related Pol polyprotein from transposon 17.6, partial [Mucuna pruriens]
MTHSLGQRKFSQRDSQLRPSQQGSQKFQLQELDELRLEAYENSRIYKQKVKKFHDQQILRKDLRVGQKTDLKSLTKNSSSTTPPMELKPLLNHLNYAYLDNKEQLPIIIANNLCQEQEDKLLNVLRQQKKAIGWKLSDLPDINPFICMHRILMEEEIKPIRQQQRRLNLTILDVVKKEVTKLLATGIIYPISDTQWVSPMQVVSKKSGMMFTKNKQDELINTRLPSPVHLAPLRTPTCHLDYVMLQRCVISLFSDLLEDFMEVFMDDFTVYADSFEACLSNLSKVLKRCIDTNLVLNCEKCHFMVTEGIMLGHLVSNRGIEVGKSKIDIISSLPNLTSVRDCNFAYDQAGEQRKFQLQELDELLLEAYESSKIYKQKVKKFQDLQ